MNHSNAVPEIPIEDSRFITILWSRVSKAADIARKMITEPCGDASDISILHYSDIGLICDFHGDKNLVDEHQLVRGFGER